MGVKGLKSHINSKINIYEGVEMVSLETLRNMTIAVDFTNLLYKFLSRKSYLLELINFIHKFQKYNINLLFVFDGKPDDEKMRIIKSRKTYRDKMKKILDDIMESDDSTKEANKDFIKILEKRSNKITMKHIRECKQLFTDLGVMFIHIKDLEADAIFKYLLDYTNTDICFSNDMDMLVYGCHTVIQDLDYVNDRILKINYHKLLKDMKLTREEFLHVCILSGTDYNGNLIKSNFDQNLELIRKYKTIDEVKNTLAKINAELEISKKMSFPRYFNWTHTFDIYTKKIDSMIMDEINKQFLQSKMDYFISLASNINVVIDKFIKLLENIKDKYWGDYDKYSKKLSQYAFWKFKIELKLDEVSYAISA